MHSWSRQVSSATSTNQDAERGGRPDVGQRGDCEGFGALSTFQHSDRRPTEQGPFPNTSLTADLREAMLLWLSNVASHRALRARFNTNVAVRS